MKKFFYILSLVILGVAFTSCEKEEGITYVDAKLVFNTPAEFNTLDATFGLKSLQLTEKNTGAVIDLVNIVTKAEGEAAPASKFIPTVNARVPEGLYTVDMKAMVNYTSDGEFYTKEVISFTEGVEITSLTAAAPYNFTCSVVDPATGSGFVLAEIFFAGTATPEGKQYDGDKYFRIYNNSDKELCANGLTIAESKFMTVGKEDYTPNVMSEAFSADAIYRIPLDGEKIMVKPGESLLIVDVAKNHKEANPNSFDLSKADFEWYDEFEHPTVSDIDTEAPNLEKIHCSSNTVWGPHNRGFSAFVLCRLGDSEDKQLAKEEYLKDYHYDYTYEFKFNDMSFPMKGDAYKIPNKWVIDAVNLSIESMYEWLVTDPSLDRGWSYCGKVDHDDSRYGKSVRRKVVFGNVLKDTNNSSEDFMAEQKADPFYKFHE